jgi:hypothetical protein
MDAPLLPSQFIFSQSSLQDYSDCPRRFQLRYIDQLQWPAIETEPILENERRQQEGQQFHRMVQQHLLGLPAEKISRIATTTDLAQWWENFLTSNDQPILKSGKVLYPEVTLTAPVGNCRLLAKYDLVAVAPGENTCIYDWKTSPHRPKDEWIASRLQTRVYRALLIQAGAALNAGDSFLPEQIEMLYWYSNHPFNPSHFSYDTTHFNQDWGYLTSLINEITNHRHFPLIADEKKCSYCTYRSFCNRGSKAGLLDETADAEMIAGDINFEQIAEIEF